MPKIVHLPLHLLFGHWLLCFKSNGQVLPVVGRHALKFSIYLPHHADRMWHKVSLMWGARGRTPGPDPKIAKLPQTSVTLALVLQSILPTLVEWERYCLGQIFPGTDHLSIIFSFTLCLQTESQLNCPLCDDRDTIERPNVVHPPEDRLCFLPVPLWQDVNQGKFNVGSPSTCTRARSKNSPKIQFICPRVDTTLWSQTAPPPDVNRIEKRDVIVEKGFQNLHNFTFT